MYFPSNAFATSSRMATCCCFCFLFQIFVFFFAVAVPRLRKPSNAFPRRLCETPNKMHNTMCCTMCGVYRFSHVSSNFLVFLIDECVKRQN